MTDALITKSTVSENELKKINTYARRKLNADELYTFHVELCNNDIDRDFEKFSVQALKELAPLFVGKTGICDHSMKSSDQKARIFDTYVEKVAGKKTADGEDFYRLMAKAYMLNTPENKVLIDEIDAGIKKEVSVSCSMSKSICSICSGDRKKGRCEHINGRIYKNETCFSILSDPTDAYEFSFVAVPAQREAGITKSFKAKGENMESIIKAMKDCEKDIMVSKSQADSILNYIDELEEKARLGEEYKKNLAKEVSKSFSFNFPDMDKKAISSLVAVMTMKELLCFKESFAKKSKASPQAQLAKNEAKQKQDLSEFKI